MYQCLNQKTSVTNALICTILIFGLSSLRTIGPTLYKDYVLEIKCNAKLYKCPY